MPETDIKVCGLGRERPRCPDGLVRSKPAHEQQYKEDDEDDAEDTDAAVTEAVTVATEAATEAA